VATFRAAARVLPNPLRDFVEELPGDAGFPTGWLPEGDGEAMGDTLLKACQIRHHRVKGQGLRKNGNAYLSWAFHEAGHFAVRFQPDAKRWYEKKRSKTCPLVAIRALAHKLARAAYFMMRDQVPYEPKRLFG